MNTSTFIAGMHEHLSVLNMAEESKLTEHLQKLCMLSFHLIAMEYLQDATNKETKSPVEG